MRAAAVRDDVTSDFLGRWASTLSSESETRCVCCFTPCVLVRDRTKTRVGSYVAFSRSIKLSAEDSSEFPLDGCP
jgi:hypothetical protein